MKAVRIHTFGGPDVLSYEEVLLAEPGAGQARVKIEAVGVNYFDIVQRSGRLCVAVATASMTSSNTSTGAT